MPVPGARIPRSSRNGLSVTRTSRIAESGTRGPLLSPPTFSRSFSSTTSSPPSSLSVAISAPSVNVAAFPASEKQARQGRREPRQLCLSGRPRTRPRAALQPPGTRRTFAEGALKAQSLEHRLVAAPFRGRLDLELEVDGMSHELLDERPRVAPDLAHDAAALADQDLLLALRLGVQPHVHELLVQLDDLGRDGVRQLLAHELERLLPDELRDARLERHVGVGVRGEVLRPFGEERDEVGAQLVDAVVREGAHRVQRVERSELGRGLHLRGDVARLEAVDLVDDDDDRDAEREDLAGDEAVSRT